MSNKPNFIQNIFYQNYTQKTQQWFISWYLDEKGSPKFCKLVYRHLGQCKRETEIYWNKALVLMKRVNAFKPSVPL